MQKIVTISAILMFSAVVVFAGINYNTPTKIEPLSEEMSVVEVEYPHPAKWVSNKLLIYIMNTSEKLGVPYQLVFKVIEVESEWRQKAKNVNTNGSTDYGLMQINSKYEKEFYWRYGKEGVKYDVKKSAFDNVYMGISHLKRMYDVTHNWKKAVQAYNAGLTRVRKNKIPNSTKDYADEIVPVEGWWDSPKNVRILY